MDIDGNELLDFTRSDLIYQFLVGEYGWNEVQQSLFQALIDEKPKKDYVSIAQVFWFAILDKLDIDRDMAVALINYRCNPYDSPYEDNLAWSITSSLYNLDYANSEYNAFRDEKIINIINERFNGQISGAITGEQYWKLRVIKDAYPEDHVCAIPIPVSADWLYKFQFVEETL